MSEPLTLETWARETLEKGEWGCWHVSIGALPRASTCDECRSNLAAAGARLAREAIEAECEAINPFISNDEYESARARARNLCGEADE